MRSWVVWCQGKGKGGKDKEKDKEKGKKAGEHQLSHGSFGMG